MSSPLHCTRRIRSLENHVAEIRQTQTVIQNTLVEIAAHLRSGSHFQARSHSAYPPFVHQSPSVHSMGSPSMSTPTVGTHPPQLMVDTAHGQTPTPGGSSVTPQMMSGHPSMPFQTPPLPGSGHRSMGSGDMRGPIPNNMYSPKQQHNGARATTMKPFSSIDRMGTTRGQQSNVYSMRYHTGDKRQQRKNEIGRAQV